MARSHLWLAAIALSLFLSDAEASALRRRTNVIAETAPLAPKRPELSINFQTARDSNDFQKLSELLTETVKVSRENVDYGFEMFFKDSHQYTTQMRMVACEQVDLEMVLNDFLEDEKLALEALDVLLQMWSQYRQMLGISMESEHYIVCGRQGLDSPRSCSGEYDLVSDMESHEVRCCSDVAIEGWETSCPSIWIQTSKETCRNARTYDVANKMCASEGGRLCTKREIESNCVSEQGCMMDYDMVWSCTSGTGKTDINECGPKKVVVPEESSVEVHSVEEHGTQPSVVTENSDSHEFDVMMNYVVDGKWETATSMLHAVANLEDAVKLLPAVTKSEIETLMSKNEISSVEKMIEHLRSKVIIRIDLLETNNANPHELEYHKELVVFYNTLIDFVSSNLSLSIENMCTLPNGLTNNDGSEGIHTYGEMILDMKQGEWIGATSMLSEPTNLLSGMMLLDLNVRSDVVSMINGGDIHGAVRRLELVLSLIEEHMSGLDLGSDEYTYSVAADAFYSALIEMVKSCFGGELTNEESVAIHDAVLETASAEEPVAADELAAVADEPAAVSDEQAADEPAADQPVAAADKPATAADEPATSADEPAAAADELAAAADEPAVGEDEQAAAADEPAAASNESAAAADELAADQLVAANGPAAAAAEPAAGEDEPAADEPAAEEPAAEEAAADEPAAEEPAADEPAAGAAENATEHITEEEVAAEEGESVLACDVEYKFENLNLLFESTKSWEDLTKLFAYPKDNNWEDVLKLISDKKRVEIMGLIQDFEQERAVTLVQGIDQKVVDHIENMKACGKENDLSMSFHEAHRKLYQYIIEQINKEFEVVARNYVTDTPHAYKAGTLLRGMFIREEFRKEWAKCKDMLSSPISIWDASSMIFKPPEKKAFNAMVLDKNSEGIVAAVEKQKSAVNVKISKASEEELEYWQNKLRFYDFVVADLRLRGIDYPTADEPAVEEAAVDEPATEEAAAEEPAEEEPAAEEAAADEPAAEEAATEEAGAEEPAEEDSTVKCNDNYAVSNMSKNYHVTRGSWEELKARLALPSESNWEEAMQQVRGSVRKSVGQFIQAFEQEKAVALLQSHDKYVTDHMENFKSCGKEGDASMVFHQAHHEFYQYLINHINDEFKLVARDYVTGTPHNFKAGTVRAKTLRGAERGKKWAEATDIISSPITVWDAIKVIGLRKVNTKVRDGESEEVLKQVAKARKKAEKSLSKAKGDEAEAYWNNKLKFFDFFVDDVNQRMGLALA